MLDAVWAFLCDPSTRATLAWIGTGIAAVAGGVWAVIRFFASKGKSGPAPSVKADNSSIAIGGDNTGDVNIGTRPPGKRQAS